MKVAILRSSIYNIKFDIFRHLSDECNFEITSDTHYYFNMSADIKIAFVEPLYRIGMSMEHDLNLIRSISDYVIFYSIELAPPIIDAIKSLDYSNVHFILPGRLSFLIENATVEYNYRWLVSTSHFYVDFLPSLLVDQHKSFETKPYYFEVMYGAARPHRSYVHEWIGLRKLDKFVFKESPFLKVSSMDYNVVHTNTEWDDDIIEDPNGVISYHGYTGLVPSQVVPFSIYNEAAYSLVCETSYNNEYFFPTEKIAKPLVACRLFVVICERHYLKNLREIGFKTFDGIIDESYDNEPNNEKRWDMALEECVKLAQRDQKEVLMKCVGILLHNYRRLKELSSDDCNNTHRYVEDKIEESVLIELLNTSDKSN